MAGVTGLLQGREAEDSDFLAEARPIRCRGRETEDIQAQTRDCCTAQEGAEDQQGNTPVLQGSRRERSPRQVTESDSLRRTQLAGVQILQNPV